MRVLLAVLVAAAALPGLPARAQPQRGVIAYIRGDTIHVARPDGSGERAYATGRAPSLSGTSVAYAVRSGGALQLVTGRLDDPASVRQVTTLPDRERELGPGRFGVTGSVWSPKGSWLALRLMEGSTTTLGFVRPDGSEFRRMAFGHLFGTAVAWRGEDGVAIRTEEGLRVVTTNGAASVPPGAGGTDSPAAWLDADRLVVNSADGVTVIDVAAGKRSDLLAGAVAWAATPDGRIVYTTSDTIGAIGADGTKAWQEALPPGAQVRGVTGNPLLVELALPDGSVEIHAVRPAGGAAALQRVARGAELAASPTADLAAVRPPAAPPPGTRATAPGVPAGPAAPRPSAVAAPGPVDPPPGRSAFAAAVPAAHEVGTEVSVILVNALLALLLMLLVTFPAELFNSTLEEHYDEVRGWFRRAPRDPDARSSRARRGAAFAAYSAVAALLYGLLDPGFGPDATSARLYLGLLAGLVVVTLVFGAAPLAYARRRYGERGVLRVLPGTLLVGVVCVAVSRLARFEPGYLYGIVGGFAFARAFSREEEGRNALAGALGVLGVALVAWLAWQPVDAAAAGGNPGLLLGLADSTLVTIAVGGLQGLVVGLVPVRSLQGYALSRWRKPVWGALYAGVLFVFIHLLLRPGSGAVPGARAVPFYTWLGLFAGFGAASVAFWAYFRLRRRACLLSP